MMKKIPKSGGNSRSTSKTAPRVVSLKGKNGGLVENS
jgi:hypothetical protein